MENIREELEELIDINGTMDKRVLQLSQKLDDYIVDYYKDQLALN